MYEKPVQFLSVYHMFRVLFERSVCYYRVPEAIVWEFEFPIPVALSHALDFLIEYDIPYEFWTDNNLFVANTPSYLRIRTNEVERALFGNFSGKSRKPSRLLATRRPSR